MVRVSVVQRTEETGNPYDDAGYTEDDHPEPGNAGSGKFPPYQEQNDCSRNDEPFLSLDANLKHATLTSFTDMLYHTGSREKVCALMNRDSIRVRQPGI